MSDSKVKLILIGEGEVGKTAIITQFVQGYFQEDYIQTVSQDKSFKQVTIDGKVIDLEIWDTIGQEKYNAANKIFMKNAKIALIVYDITKQESFDKLPKWIEQLNEVVGINNVVIGVVGNKSDLYEDQVVSKETGEEYAKTIKALFFETSAMDKESIDNLFNEIVKDYVKKNKPIQPNIGGGGSDNNDNNDNDNDNKDNNIKKEQVGDSGNNNGGNIKITKDVQKEKDKQKKEEKGGCCGSKKK